MRLFLLATLLLTGCAASSSERQVARLDATPRTEEEQAAQNRADLETLLARAKAMPAAPKTKMPEQHEAPPAQTPPAPQTPVDPFDDLLPAGHIASEVVARFVAAGPQHLLRSLETEPARLNGRLLGFRVVSIAPDAAFLRRAGLLPGDIITSVNGSSLLTPDEFMKVWSALPKATAIDLSLQRGSETIARSWSIDAQQAPQP